VTIIYFLLVKLIKFFPLSFYYIASYQLWWIKIFKSRTSNPQRFYLGETLGTR